MNKKSRIQSANDDVDSHGNSTAVIFDKHDPYLCHC